MAAWLGRAIKGAGTALRGGGKGFATIRSNVGFGWSALKGDPRTVFGTSWLRDIGGMASAMGRNPGTYGREPGMWRMVGRNLKGWGTATDLRRHGKLRGLAVGARMGGAGIGVPAAADFLNPWGLGWGD